MTAFHLIDNCHLWRTNPHYTSIHFRSQHDILHFIIRIFIFLLRFVRDEMNLHLFITFCNKDILLCNILSILFCHTSLRTLQKSIPENTLIITFFSILRIENYLEIQFMYCIVYRSLWHKLWFSPMAVSIMAMIFFLRNDIKVKFP